MEKILELLKQRRVWAGIISGLVFVVGMFGVTWDLDTQTLVDLLTQLGSAIAALVTAVLALHSYFKPKK